MKKTIVFDFDGVIHKYSKGWQDGTIYDTANDNIKEVIKELRSNGYEVVIVSTRCSTEEGINNINKWLQNNSIVVDKVCKEKPPALVYVDDRAICYDPMSTNLYSQITQFTPNQDIETKYKNFTDFETLMVLKMKQQQFEQVNKLLNDKYKNDPIISLKIMDEWIASVQKYL